MRLTGTVDTRHEEETVGGDVGLRVNEVPNGARRMIEPCPGADTTLRRERERHVLGTIDVYLGIDDRGIGERNGSKLRRRGQLR